MKTIIISNNLGCGGAQKSLVSMLSLLSKEDGMSIDLMILDEESTFFDNIPNWINRIHPPKEMKALHMPIGRLLKAKLNLGIKIKSVISKFLLKIQKKEDYNTVQRIWNSWKGLIPNCKEEYDLAISYVDGFSNYYLIDKVKSRKKIIWVHNEYEKLSYSAKYDLPYFKKADKIVTISDLCVKSLQESFTTLSENKFAMLPNLSSGKIIWEMANKGIPEEFEGRKNIIVSIGRLNEQKGFDIAINAAKEMQSMIDEFYWFVIGGGELQEKLQKQIDDLGLGGNFFLIGKRTNPYVYIKNCDVFAQTSRYEGKSIVLDEAKILEKPIVVTNYTTVYDSIEPNKNGLVVNLDAVEIARGIVSLLNNKSICARYIATLKEENALNSDGIDLYINLFKDIIEGQG